MYIRSERPSVVMILEATKTVRSFNAIVQRSLGRCVSGGMFLSAISLEMIGDDWLYEVMGQVQFRGDPKVMQGLVVAYLVGGITLMASVYFDELKQRTMASPVEPKPLALEVIDTCKLTFDLTMLESPHMEDYLN